MLPDKFKKLEYSDYGLFHSFSSRFGGESCERSWANLLLYQDTYSWEYALIGEQLWIASFKESYLFFPLGDFIEPAQLAELLHAFSGANSTDWVIGDVPEQYLQKYPEAAAFFEFETDPGEADYIYELKHLHGFSGNKLRKRHNQVRQFEKLYAECFCVKTLEFDMLDDVVGFASILSKDYWSDDTGLEEKLAFDRLKELWLAPDLNLAGIGLFVNGALAGFSIYSPLSDTLADIHFEKADHSFRGCGAELTALLTEHLLERGFLYMNREQDLNSEGLRRAKQALDPDHFWHRQNIVKIKGR